MTNRATQLPRVLMVVPQYPYPVVGGLERQAHELAKALVALGQSVQAVSGRTAPGQPAKEWVDGILVHRIPWARIKALRFLRTPVDLLSVLVRQRHSYEIVHLHQLSWFSLFVVPVARLLRKPILAKMPGVGPYGLPGLASSRFGALKISILRQVDAVVAMSRQSLLELESVGFPLSRTLLTPNGIQVRPEAEELRDSTDARSECRVVFVGRLSAEKALNGLLNAWRRITDSVTQRVTLEMWGSGPLESDLKRYSANLGIEESVAFRGHVDNVREKLKSMDIFVLPSLTEGNSNAILEAMAAGLPIVSTRVGGTAMQVGPEGAAFLVDPGDEAGLHDRLAELMVDRALREQVGLAMRRRIVTHFDIRHIAETYAGAYRLLADGRPDQLQEIANPVITEDCKLTPVA